MEEPKMRDNGLEARFPGPGPVEVTLTTGSLLKSLSASFL